jgi:transcriptional antiterminator NusG
MTASWYVLHTYSGHENRVKLNLEQRVRTMEMSESLEQILVPTQQVTEIKDGKKKTSTKISFPGYVLIKMNLSDELWYVVRNTPGVMGFVGGGTNPTPLEDEEVENILSSGERRAQEEAKRAFEFSVGDRVKVIDGPFTGFSGLVDELNEEKSKLRLMISIFGRSTPVELEFHQVEKVLDY